MYPIVCFPPLPLGEGWGEGKICPRLSSPPVMTQTGGVELPGAGAVRGMALSPGHVHRIVNVQGKSLYE